MGGGWSLGSILWVGQSWSPGCRKGIDGAILGGFPFPRLPLANANLFLYNKDVWQQHGDNRGCLFFCLSSKTRSCAEPAGGQGVFAVACLCATVGQSGCGQHQQTRPVWQGRRGHTDSPTEQRQTEDRRRNKASCRGGGWLVMGAGGLGWAHAGCHYWKSC